LVVVLLIAAVYAAWTWLRPYEWQSDAAARFRITGALLTRDHANHWLELRLKKAGAAEHDLLKPVRLVLEGGREAAPAETTLVGDEATGTTEIWFKFWLEPGDLNGPLRLRLNDGVLRVKTNAGEPRFGVTGRKVFNTSHW
jgi:hypothetical protein